MSHYLFREFFAYFFMTHRFTVFCFLLYITYKHLSHYILKFKFKFKINFNLCSWPPIIVLCGCGFFLFVYFFSLKLIMLFQNSDI